MKQGWTYKKLGEVCDYSIGLTYKPSDVNDNGTIVLRSSNIQNEQIDLNDIVRVKCPIKELLYVQKGDILMCSRNGSARLVGKVAMIPELKERMTYGTFMMIIRSEYNPFLLYFFKSDVFRNQIKHGEANMINQITRYMLDDVVVSLPPFSEQQRIVKRLDAAFAHIDELKANAEKQLSEARTLFQKALAKAMEPKEEWEEKKIKDIANVKGGKRVPKGYKLESQDTGYKYIRVADFTDNGTIDESNIQYISKEVYEQIKNYTITDNDVYISIAGTIGKSGIIPSSLNGANLTENACKMVFTSSVDKHYIYLCTKTDDFKKQIMKATKQASQPKLALTRLAEVIIPFPPFSEQQRIVARLDSLSENVRKYEEIQQKVIAECDALKQALLRKVFV